MYFENLLATTNIGQRHHDLAVETSRSQQCGVKYVGAVRRRDDNNAFTAFESVHFDQHLVQRLLTFVMTTAETGATMAANSVQLVDENYAGRLFLCLVEHVAYA